MPDFLTRLAERALGTAEVVRPAVAPLFAEGPALATKPAPGSRDEVIESDDELDGTAAPAYERTIPMGPALFLDSAPRFPGRAPDWTSGRVRAHDGSLPTAGSAGSGPVPRPASVVPGDDPIRKGFRDAGRVVPALSVAPAPTGRGHLVGLPPRRPDAIERGGQATADAAGSLGTAAIRVTIGRVEVKAVVAPQPSTRPRVSPRPAALSLEDYLRQRSSGQR